MNIITFYCDYENNELVYNVCKVINEIKIKRVGELLSHLPKNSYVIKVDEKNVPISKLSIKYSDIVDFDVIHHQSDRRYIY